MAAPSLIAGSEFRNEKLTAITSKEAVSSDAPALLPLLSQLPGIFIVTPSSASFEESNKIYQRDASAVPVALIRPTTVAEVAATVHFAVSATPPLPICVRAGGHDLYGRSNVPGSVILDLKEIDSIELAPDRKSATIGGGTIFSNLTRFLELHGLSISLGGCHSVGFTGWATCGGYGSYNGAFGLGVDQILGATVVTPKGDIIEADDDLLWGLRGGGCNFGVVTSLKIKVHDVPKIMAGMIVFPISEAKKVLLGYQKLLDEDHPGSYGGDKTLMNFPGVGPVLAFLYTWASNDLKAGETFANKIKGLGTVAMETVSETTQAAWLEFGKAFQPDGVYMNMRSVYTSLQMTEPLIDILLSYTEKLPTVPSSKSAMLLHSYHGLAATPNPDSCFKKREPHTLIEIIGANQAKDEKDADYDWSDGLERELKEKGLASGGSYSALTAPGWGDVSSDEFFGRQWERLAELKKKVDPENVFSSVPALA